MPCSDPVLFGPLDDERRAGVLRGRGRASRAADRGGCTERRPGRHRRVPGRNGRRLHRDLYAQETGPCVACRAATFAAMSSSRHRYAAPVLSGIEVDTWENGPELWRAHCRRPAAAGNKFGRGHALLCGGYPMTGAAAWRRAPRRAHGAGLTSIAVPEAALPIYAAALTSIMVQPLSRPADLPACSRIPLHGVHDRSRRRRQRAHPRACTRHAGHRRAVVLDADAISVFAGRLGICCRRDQGPCVLTPHEGEFARLFDRYRRQAERARGRAGPAAPSSF